MHDGFEMPSGNRNRMDEWGNLGDKTSYFVFQDRHQLSVQVTIQLASTDTFTLPARSLVLVFGSEHNAKLSRYV
jgi:hypothetical protein